MRGQPTLRTALALLLEDAAPTVAAARTELAPELAARIPLHITILHPFVPRAELDAALLAELRVLFATFPAPSFSLARVEIFPGVVAFAAPEPDDGLVALMRAVCARYPELPPYGGGISEPVPHATLAVLDGAGDATLDRVRARVEPLLPVACTLQAASLVEEVEPDRWRELEPLSFGEAVAAA